MIGESQMELSLKERLEAGGNLTVKETCVLANIGITKFYSDVKAGRVRVIKRGKKSVVSAEIAKAYIAGKPLAEADAA
jgi:hypothetical protein